MEVPVGDTHTFANRSEEPVVFLVEPARRFENYM